jgi:undecaprenyl diphosphate synthase
MNKLNHVAIIMDGNGRWGLKKKGSRNYGHLQGVKTVEAVIKHSLVQKIPHLTLYTFSTENWNRPDNEISFLFDLIRKSLKKKIKKIIKQGIKVKIIGQKRGLPEDIIEIVKLIEKKTLNNKRITLNLALNYGSKEEIINACKSLVLKKGKKINFIFWSFPIFG